MKYKNYHKNELRNVLKFKLVVVVKEVYAKIQVRNRYYIIPVYFNKYYL